MEHISYERTFFGITDVPGIRSAVFWSILVRNFQKKEGSSMIKKLYYRYQQFWNYAIVGGITSVIILGLFFLLTSTWLDPKNGLQLQLANIISV